MRDKGIYSTFCAHWKRGATKTVAVSVLQDENLRCPLEATQAHFRSAESRELSSDLKIFVGPNDAGKSAIIDAARYVLRCEFSLK